MTQRLDLGTVAVSAALAAGGWLASDWIKGRDALAAHRLESVQSQLVHISETLAHQTTTLGEVSERVATIEARGEIFWQRLDAQSDRIANINDHLFTPRLKEGQ